MIDLKSKKVLTAGAILTLAVAALAVAALAERHHDGGHWRDQMRMKPSFDVAAMDADKDGKVTQAEMNAYRAGRTAAIDANSDGFLSADELTAMQLKAMESQAAAGATAMIARLDTDADGKVSVAEMAARPAPELAFSRLDANGDGAITQDEADTEIASMQRHGRGGSGHDEGEGWGFGDDDADSGDNP